MAMLSRVAETLYWMSRYLERAESTARLINVNGGLMLDLPRQYRPGWSMLIAITGSFDLFQQRNMAATEKNVVHFMIGDDANPGDMIPSSILASIRCARENARTVRDIIPREAWEQINELYIKARENLASGLSPKLRYAYLKSIILGVQQITGILSGGMSHDAGYDFMRLGRNLERADMTTRIVDVGASTIAPERDETLKSFESIRWMSVLKSLTAYQMYRRNMQAAVRRDAVLDYLLKDAALPRAFYFCLREARQCLERLPHGAAPLAILTRLMEEIESAQPENLSQEALSQFVDILQVRLGEIHEAIVAAYFEAGPLGGQEQAQDSA
jgi:uncharacterized alpha-E superfamily protein